MTTKLSHSQGAAPDVSVIMPAWRAAGTIETTIDSVLASQRVSLELIIVDDASTDQTYAILERRAAADPRIRIARLAVNAGPSGARNRALDMARGRYVAVVDSDDAIALSRLNKLVALADASGADIVVDNMLEIDADGEQFGQGAFLKSNAFNRPREITLADYVRYNHPLKPGDCLGYLKPLFRRTTLERLEARYDPDLRNSEDYYLVAGLLARGASMTYTPYAGYFYRRAVGSTSHRLQPAHTGAWLKAEAAFRDAYLEGLEPAALHQLDVRQRKLLDTDQMVRAIDAIQKRRIGDLFSLLAADPRAALFTLSWFAKVGWWRATGTTPGLGAQTASA